jgi:hypothetical protein
MNLKNKDKYNKNKERNQERKKLLKNKQNNHNKEQLDPLLNISNHKTNSINTTQPGDTTPDVTTPVVKSPDIVTLSVETKQNELSDVKNPLIEKQKKIDKKIKSKPFKEHNKEMDSIQNEMKEIEFKNPIFEKNVIDPTNNKIVKSIYVHSWTKLARDHWFMIWQYYRDRKRTSIQEVYDKYKDTQLRIIYKGDSNMYYVGEKKEKPEPKIRNKLQKNISES